MDEIPSDRHPRAARHARPGPRARTAAYVAAIVLGLLLAVLVVLNFLFAEVTSGADRLSTFVVVMAIYGAAGFLMGLASPVLGRRWGTWLALPAVVLLEVVLLLSLLAGDPLRRLALILAYAGLSLASASAGGWAGGRFGLVLREWLRNR